MNRYIFEKVLAERNHTRLSLCRLNNSEGRRVVVKELIDKDHFSNFESEISALDSIPFHTNIISLEDSFLFGNKGFSVFNYFPLGDLFHFVQRNGPLSENQVFQLISQIASALLHARDHGFFHCDLKAENILMRDKNDFVLSDWDMARPSHLRKISFHYGSSLSMAPEVMLGYLHENSDVYSLGCLAHYCLFGKRALGLTGNSLPHERVLAHLETGYEIPKNKYSQNMIILINSMMVKNPKFRASLTDVFHHINGLVKLSMPDSFGTDLYENISDFIGEKYSSACMAKSINRICQEQGKCDSPRKDSLILAHRLILSYLNDGNSQSILSEEYNSGLFKCFPNRSKVWRERAKKSSVESCQM